MVMEKGFYALCPRRRGDVSCSKCKWSRNSAAKARSDFLYGARNG